MSLAILIFLQVAYHGDSLLKNPLAEAFLHLKWSMIKRFFYFNVFVYTLFVFALTSLAISATVIVTDYRSPIRTDVRSDLSFFIIE